MTTIIDLSARREALHARAARMLETVCAESVQTRTDLYSSDNLTSLSGTFTAENTAWMRSICGADPEFGPQHKPGNLSDYVQLFEGLPFGGLPCDSEPAA